MSTWSESWKATHSNFVKANKDVKSVLEHRNVEGGELYCVALTAGGFEVRRYVDGKVKSASQFPSGLKAVVAYRELRDTLVPNRKPIATAKPKKKVAKKATK